MSNDAFDARNFFDRGQKSPLRLNQFGGSVGGPIVKDKTFFFVSYEGLQQRAVFNLLGQVTSAAARARAVPASQPLLAAYPKCIAPTANADFNIAQLQGSNTLEENSGGIPINETKFGYNGPKTRTYGIAPTLPGIDLSATTVIIGGANVLAGIGGQGSSAGIAIPSGLVRANSSTDGRGQPTPTTRFLISTT